MSYNYIHAGKDDQNDDVIFIFNSLDSEQVQHIFNTYQQFTIIYFIAKEFYQSKYSKFRSQLKSQSITNLITKLKDLYLYNLGNIQRTIQYFDCTAKNNVIYSKIHLMKSIIQTFNNRIFDSSLLLQIPIQYQQQLNLNMNNIKVNGLNQNIYNYKINDQTGIPELLENLIRIQQNYLEVEGLFRKSPEIEEFEQFYGQLEQGNYEVLNNIQNPHLISKSILRFIAHLKQPLIELEQLENIKNINKQSIEYRVLCEIFNLLEQVDQKSDKNNMNIKNLAIVFTPSLIRLRNDQLYKIKEIIIKIEQLLIDYQNDNSWFKQKI